VCPPSDKALALTSQKANKEALAARIQELEARVAKYEAAEYAAAKKDRRCECH
jgi:BMFP domain-containing protein YqiC